MMCIVRSNFHSRTAFSSPNGLAFLAAAEEGRCGSICDARLVDSSMTALSKLFLLVAPFVEGGSEKGLLILVGVSSSMIVIAADSRSLPGVELSSGHSSSAMGVDASEDDCFDPFMSTVLGPLPTRTTCGRTEVAVDALAFLKKVEPMLKAGEGGGLSYFSKFTVGTGGAESSLFVLGARDFTLTSDGLRKLPF